MLFSSLIKLQVVALKESLPMVLLLKLQKWSVLEDQLSATFEKLLIIVLPYSKL